MPTTEDSATVRKTPEFAEGCWYYPGDKAEQNRFKTTEALYGDVVYGRFKTKYIAGNSDFKVEVKAYESVKNGKKGIEKTGEIKIDCGEIKAEAVESNAEGKKFEFKLELKKETFQKGGGSLVLEFYIKTKDTDYDLPNKKKGAVEKFFPEKADDYLSVNPPLKYAVVRVKILDARTGKICAKEPVEEIYISNGDSNGVHFYFKEENGKIDVRSENKDRYGVKDTQTALNCYYDVMPGPLVKYIEKYSCGKKVGAEFSDVQKTSYEKYLKDRGYLDEGGSSSGTVKKLGAKEKIPPLSVRQLIIDEYNGMSRTDDSGHLNMYIPVDKFINAKQVDVKVRLKYAPILLEKINKDDRTKPVCRKDSGGFFSSAKLEAEQPLMKIEWDKDLKTSGDLRGGTKWTLRDSNKNKYTFGETEILYINAGKEKIEDYPDIDRNDKGYSIFFEEYDKDKSKTKWQKKNIPFKTETNTHFCLFKMNYWGNEEQAQYWKEEVLDISKKNNFKYEFDDNKINVIGIRKGGLRYIAGINVFNDIYVVVLKKKVLGIFYGSVDPGTVLNREKVAVGHSIMEPGQYKNFVRAIDEKAAGKPYAKFGGALYLKQELAINTTTNKNEYARSKFDANKNGMENDPDDIDVFWNPQKGYTNKDDPKRIYGDPGCLIHFGGPGYKSSNNKWTTVDAVGNYSWGCQVICGSHYLKPDGMLDIKKVQEVDHWNKGKPGAYSDFVSIWKNNNEDVVYTLIKENDIKEPDRYYQMYRKVIFF